MKANPVEPGLVAVERTPDLGEELVGNRVVGGHLRRAPSWDTARCLESSDAVLVGGNRPPAGGQWLVIFVFSGQIGAPFSRRIQTGSAKPNAFRSAVFVPLLEKPVTNRNSRGPGIVLHFGLCPAVTRGAHSRHERFDGGRLPRIVYSMAGILCPQTSDTFPSFRAGSGHRFSVAVESEIRGSSVPFRLVGLL